MKQVNELSYQVRILVDNTGIATATFSVPLDGWIVRLQLTIAPQTAGSAAEDFLFAWITPNLIGPINSVAVSGVTPQQIWLVNRCYARFVAAEANSQVSAVTTFVNPCSFRVQRGMNIFIQGAMSSANNFAVSALIGFRPGN